MDAIDRVLVEAYCVILRTQFRIDAQAWRTLKESAGDRETLNALSDEMGVLYEELADFEAALNDTPRQPGALF
jgi:hypothetical protein